jgi:hypothetical protein
MPRRSTSPSVSSLPRIWFIVWGVTKERRASWALESPGRSASTLIAAYCGVVTPRPLRASSILSLKECWALLSS